MTKELRREGEMAEQSGVLPYRKGKAGLEVLLVTSSDTGRWVPPKGNLESGMSPRDSAAKEAYEEAGIAGKVAKKPLGSYAYRKSDAKGGHLCRVALYAMKVERVEEQWPEMDLRNRRWMPVAEAATAVAEPALSALIDAFGKDAEAG